MGDHPHETAADETETRTYGSDARIEQFNMRKQIRSTIYEVAVYFSRASRETLGDKILRLALGEALNKDDDSNEKSGENEN
jgi:hypothetical protein